MIYIILSSIFTNIYINLDKKHLNEDQENEDEDEDEEETISSRFVRVLLLHILKGYEAKSNSVRLRCCQIIALSISCLGEIE